MEQFDFSLYPTLPDDVEAAVHGLTESDFDLCRAPGAWSIREIIHHIVDAYTTTWHCVFAAVGKSGTPYYLDWYDESNSWAVTMHYAHRPVDPALALLRAFHVYTNGVLEHVPDVHRCHVRYHRTRVASERKLTVRELLTHLNSHIHHHLDQIRATRAKYGKAVAVVNRPPAPALAEAGYLSRV